MFLVFLNLQAIIGFQLNWAFTQEGINYLFLFLFIGKGHFNRINLLTPTFAWMDDYCWRNWVTLAGPLIFQAWLMYGGKSPESFEIVLRKLLGENFNFLFLVVFSNYIKLRERARLHETRSEISNRFEMSFRLHDSLHGDFTAETYQTTARLYCTCENDIF